jgi:hypothetical protein
MVDKATQTLMNALNIDSNVKNTKGRTVPGLFGLPVYQLSSKATGGAWVTVPKVVFDQAMSMVSSYKSGGAINSPSGVSTEMLQFARSVANEFYRIEGMALDTGNYTTVVSSNYCKILKASNITADEIAIVEEAGNKMLNLVGTSPNSYDEDAITDWATLALEGALVLIVLKTNFNMLQLQPQMDRADDSSVCPYTRASLASALASVKGLRVPYVSYVIANLFTRVIQVGGAEKMNSIESQYVVPTVPGCTLAHFEDQLDAMDALSKAGLFAGYIKRPLIPISEKYLTTMHVVPFYSDWAQALFDILPVADNNGGHAINEIDFTSSVNCYYNQCLGMSGLWNAGVFFRSEDAGAAACFTHQMSATADKIGLRYFDGRDATGTGTEVPDTTSRFDYMLNVAGPRSAVQRGIFGHSDNFMQYHTIAADEAGWDRRASNYLFTAAVTRRQPIVSLARLMPSIVSALSKPGVKIATANQSKYGNRG